MSYIAFINNVSNIVRQPTAIASVASLAIHGLLGLSLPALSAYSNAEKEDGKRTVGLVELTPEEQSRIPQLGQPNLPPIATQNPPLQSVPPLPSTAPPPPVGAYPYPPLPSQQGNYPISAVPRVSRYQPPRVSQRQPIQQQQQFKVKSSASRQYRLYGAPVFGRTQFSNPQTVAQRPIRQRVTPRGNLPTLKPYDPRNIDRTTFPPTGSVSINDTPSTPLRTNQNPPQTPTNQNPPETPVSINPPQTPINQNPPQTPTNQNPPQTPTNQNPPQTPTNQNPPQTPINQNPPQTPTNQNPPQPPVALNPTQTPEQQRQARLLADNRALRQSISREKAGTTDGEANSKYLDWVKQEQNLKKPEKYDLTSEKYPKDACIKKLEGTATIGVLIDGKGNVISEPVLIKSSGYSIFNEQALKDVKSHNFKNKTGDSQPYLVDVKFDYNKEICPDLSVPPTQADG